MKNLAERDNKYTSTSSNDFRLGDISIIISVLNKNKFLFYTFIYENKEINNKNVNIIANLNNKNKQC